MRVHAVSLRTSRDRAAALADAVAAVRGAVSDGADVVVLPEYASCFDPAGVGAEAAEPLDGPFVRALAEAADDRVVLAGTVLPGRDRGVNAVVALRGGEVLGVYRKVHLYDAFGQRESDRLEAGPADAPPLVVEVAGHRIGVMTCYDLRFPESARRLVDAGATVLAVPAAWAAGPGKADHWATLLRARAIESTAWVVGATQVGRGVTGGSAVVDPSGGVVAGDPGGDDPPPLAVAELDVAVVADVRRRNPSLANRRYRVVPGSPADP